MQSENHRLYIVVSQTGTVLSRLLKMITGAEYNHVSISLDENLRRMYSFGRINPYNPVWGGFVKESPDFGTFKRFRKTDAIVLYCDITKEQHEKIEKHLQAMWRKRRSYGYNFLGLLLAGLKVPLKLPNCFYCSEFARDLLLRFKIAESKQLPRISKPIDFLKLKGSHIVYKGKLRKYSNN